MFDTINRIRVLPYKSYSKSAKTLAGALGGKRLRLTNSKFKPQPSDLVINWGNSSGYEGDCTVINGNPAGLKLAINKKCFFEHFEGSDWLPSFWTDADEIPDEAFPIVCRTKITGHSGNGIVIAECRDDLVPAPLYVKYIKKQDEYRVHVGSYNDGNGNVEYTLIDLQQKKRRKEHANPNWQIRNHSNGFVYARQDVDPPISVVECAVDCLDASGLDFAAVDVIWNDKENKAYVLEINTAPGLEGTTLKRYTDYFKGNAPGLQMLGV